jgi:hypothetical protein
LATTRHTVDLAADVYAQAQAVAAAQGLALTDVTRGLYRLYLADPDLQARVAVAALQARADLRRRT